MYFLWFPSIYPFVSHRTGNFWSFINDSFWIIFRNDFFGKFLLIFWNFTSFIGNSAIYSCSDSSQSFIPCWFQISACFKSWTPALNNPNIFFRRLLCMEDVEDVITIDYRRNEFGIWSKNFVRRPVSGNTMQHSTSTFITGFSSKFMFRFP